MRHSPEGLVRNSTVASPPDVYSKLMEVISHPRSGANDIGRVLSADAGLASRLLRIVNSAFFGFPRRIDSMSQAVTMVGTTQIRDLALATSVIRVFDGVDEDVISPRRFWSYSLATGVIARSVAALKRADNPERFFLAGVLHCVGRLIMLLRAPEEERQAVALARESGQFLHEAELSTFGFTHAAVGEALVESWSLPPVFKEAIGFQLQPQRAVNYRTEAAALHMATVLASGMEWGSSGETLVLPFDGAAWDTLGLAEEALPGLFEGSRRQFDAATQSVTGAIN